MNLFSFAEEMHVQLWVHLICDKRLLLNDSLTIFMILIPTALKTRLFRVERNPVVEWAMGVLWRGGISAFPLMGGVLLDMWREECLV